MGERQIERAAGLRCEPQTGEAGLGRTVLSAHVERQPPRSARLGHQHRDPLRLTDHGAAEATPDLRLGACLRRELADERVELQLEIELAKCLSVRFSEAKIIEAQRDRQVRADRHQLLGEPGILGVAFERLARPFLHDFVDAAEDLFQGAELLDQLDRGLRSDAPHPRDVVGRVTDQR